MSLQTTTHLNVDFYDKKYILINAKQYDKGSRFLSLSCYNHGEKFHVNAGEHSAYIRFKKPDNNSVFNFCDINHKGEIIVELTEQMLASDGICCVDLVIVNKGSATVDVNTGEIITIDNAGILSTMVFYVDVSETAVENSEIESSYEYNGLNEALEKAEAEYTKVIMLSKSYAVGDAGGIRTNENADNSKYYYEQSLINANNSATNASRAATSATNAETYMHSALASSQNAETYMNNAKTYMSSASESASNAKTSETNSATSEKNAKTYMDSAEEYKDISYDCSIISQRYAVGGTNTVSDEDIDNAKYYYEQARDIVIGASVIGVKGDNESNYRKGNVNLTANHIGAIPTTDIATVDEVINYLSI